MALAIYHRSLIRVTLDGIKHRTAMPASLISDIWKRLLIALTGTWRFVNLVFLCKGDTELTCHL